MRKMPMLNIGGLEIELPIIQGGMGVEISLSGLASAVANEGGVGNIATVGLGDHGNFKGTYAEANAAGLVKEIEKARTMSNGRGVIAANVMFALSDYEKLVETVVNERIPLLFTGAGFDVDLPEKLRGSDTMAVPIISYGRFAGNVCEEWSKHDYLPAAIVIEGPMAGGHLGYTMGKLEKLQRKGLIEGTLEKEVRKAVEVVKKFGDIPIIAAGGIYTGKDIYDALSWGASGVQMGTRFVTTFECDADVRFKEEYINAKKEDIVLIKSPVGYPGRVVRNKFVDKIYGREDTGVGCVYQCLETCNPRESSFCIAKALKNAGEGNLEEGFAFAGANAYRCDKIIPVGELMETLKREYAAAADK